MQIGGLCVLSKYDDTNIGFCKYYLLFFFLSFHNKVFLTVYTLPFHIVGTRLLGYLQSAAVRDAVPSVPDVYCTLSLGWAWDQKKRT